MWLGLNLARAQTFSPKSCIFVDMGKGVYSSDLKMLFFDISHFDFVILRIYLDYLRAFVSAELLRNPNLSSESFIWAREYWELRRRGKSVYGEKRSKRTHKSVHFALDRLKRRFAGKLQLIDVGCGPSSHFYSEELANRADIEITTVDPLAKHYQKLHQQYKTPYNIKCVEGFGENLDQLFSRDSFHLVYSQNAIDHSISPELFMNNMFKILKTGGYLILHGFIKHGSNMRWMGLHKWDIEAENNDLLLTNRSKTIYRRSLTRNLNLTLVSSEIVPQTSYTYVFEKKG